MEEKIKDMLDEEIANEFQALSGLKTGSQEQTVAIDNLATLYRLRIEESKSDWEAGDKYDRLEMEKEANDRDNELKQTQIAEQVKDRYFRVGVAAAELIIPLMFYGLWMNKGFKFEETGALSSSTFKGLIKHFRPTKSRKNLKQENVQKAYSLAFAFYISLKQHTILREKEEFDNE